MSEQLFGRTLHWASWDANLAVTAALRSMLEGQSLARSSGSEAHSPCPGEVAAIRCELTLSSDPKELVALAKQQRLGLVLMVCEADTDLASLAETLTRLRALSHPPLRVCYLDSSRVALAAILIEAGAQVVVSRIPSLQAALPKMLSCVCLSPQGFHPITSRLLERLPWAPPVEASR